MICNVESFKDPKLGKYIEKYGQKQGLELYLQSLVSGVELSLSEDIPETVVADIPFAKPLAHLKALSIMEQERIDKLDSNIKAAKLKGDNDKVELLRVRKHKAVESIIKLKEKMEQLEKDSKLSSLIDVAHLQLDWVGSLFEKQDLTSSEIHEAGRALDLWYNIKNVMYGEEAIIDETVMRELNSLKSRIDDDVMFGNYFRMAAAYLSEQSGYKTPSDFLKEFYKIEDLTKFVSDWSYLGDTGIKFLHSIDRMNRDASVRIKAESEKWSRRLQKDLGGLQEAGRLTPLWQLDANGNKTGELTNRYAQKWYDDRSKAYETFRYTLANAKTKAEIKKAFRNLNSFLRNATVSVDLRYFVVEEYNESNEGVTKEMHIELLKNEFGEKRANEIIEQALEQYEKFLSDYEIHKQVTQDKVVTGELSKEDADAEIRDWNDKNSPLVWLYQTDTLGKNEERVYHQKYENRYVVNKPKMYDKNGNKTGWYDENYITIENDPELLKAYETVREFMNEMMAYLPNYIKRDLQANFLPRIKKELIYSLSSDALKGAVSGYTQDMLDSISSPAGLENRFLEQNELGKLYKTIPVKYTSKLAVDERSTDLPKILEAFGKMALNYKWKSEIQDGIELANKFLGDIAKSQERKAHTDDELTNMRKSLEWFMDSQLFEEKRIDEGVSRIKFFDGYTFDILNSELEDKVKIRFEELSKNLDSKSALAQLKTEFGEDIEIIKVKEKYKRLEKKREETEDKFYNGEITQEEYDIIMKPLEEEANSMGRNLVWSKVADKAMRYNQAMAFWFNPFSAFNNYAFGIMSNLMWSAGKVDFTPKQSIQAFGLMWKSALNLKDRKLDKAANMIAKLDLLYENLEHGSSSSENQTLRKLKEFPYILLRKGDLFIKGQTLIAMMLNKKVKVVENGVEKEISLWEAYNDNGEWNKEKYGENKDWDGDFGNKEEGTEFVKFKAYVNKVETKLHGNFDPESTPMYKKHVLKRMLGQFRASWMVEGIKQRFDKRKFDEDLGRFTEGRFTTIGKIGFKNTFEVFGKIVAGHFTGEVNLSNIPAKDRDVVLENMRKNLMEIYLYAMMLSIYFMLKAGLDDDDDDKQTKMMLNMLNRIMADTTFYLSPKTFIDIVKDPVPLLAIPIRFGRALDSAYDLMLDEDLTEREEEQKWRNITSNVYIWNQFNKLTNMQNKVFN